MTKRKTYIHFGETKVVDGEVEIELDPEMVEAMAENLPESKRESAKLHAESFKTHEELEKRLKELEKKGINPALLFLGKGKKK